MKKGFSLIEVVLAIVIIAISMMSVPMLLKQSSKSNEFSIIQESILATSTKLGNILSYSWDKNSYDASNAILRTLDVKNGDSELDRVIGSNDNNLRIGHIFYDGRRRFFDFSSIGRVYPDNIVNAAKVSINDFHNQTSTISGGGAYDYKDSSISIKSAIYYISDNANYNNQNINFTFTTPTNRPITTANYSTNIKMIVMTTTSPLLGHSLTLRTFESNIGQSNLLTRTKQ